MNHFKFYNDLSKDLVRNKYSIIRFLWRDGRVAEGAPLLRAYRVKPIEGSNPSLSANKSCLCSYVLRSTENFFKFQKVAALSCR